MMAFEILVALIAGIVYGFLKPGKEDKISLLKKGSMLGIAIALLIAVMILYSGVSSYSQFAHDEIGIVFGVIFLTALFIAGTFIGDWLEVNLKPAQQH